MKMERYTNFLQNCNKNSASIYRSETYVELRVKKSLFILAPALANKDSHKRKREPS